MKNYLLYATLVTLAITQGSFLQGEFEYLERLPEDSLLKSKCQKCFSYWPLPLKSKKEKACRNLDAILFDIHYYGPYDARTNDDEYASDSHLTIFGVDTDKRKAIRIILANETNEIKKDERDKFDNLESTIGDYPRYKEDLNNNK
jgi:hypothetical protein